ncbi:hypothetical protein I4F81_004504 [Pyropia yezoensis]|uniref:Uncharacterized protein n=1 Tax=Pyropia yezoensis TaxID=2788 RepID=A0ACC3BW58_PYRYE|nr:hypothetical protein I4F81_004504 [Neopyropia yezoensis]
METSSPPTGASSPPSPAPGAACVGDDGVASTPLPPPSSVTLATPGAPSAASLTHLIVVAGHAVFHGAPSPAAAAHPSAWTLAPFQATEAPDYENVLFALAAFHTATGAYPATLTVVSWPFKRVRFGDHVATLRWPADRYAFLGVGVPSDAATAEVGERATRRLFGEQPYGGWGVLWAKRLARSWGGQKVGGWGALDGLVAWRGPEPYPGTLPWEEGSAGATEAAAGGAEAVPALGGLSDGKGLAIKAAALAEAEMGAGPAAQGV